MGPVSLSPTQDTSTVSIFSRETSFHMQPRALVSLSKSLFLPPFHSSINDLLITCYMLCMALSTGKSLVDTADKLQCFGTHLLGTR